MEACKKADVKNIIVASSAEVYQTPNQIPTQRSFINLPNVNPRYSYGGSKIITELIALNFIKNILIEQSYLGRTMSMDQIWAQSM